MTTPRNLLFRAIHIVFRAPRNQCQRHPTTRIRSSNIRSTNRSNQGPSRLDRRRGRIQQRARGADLALEHAGFHIIMEAIDQDAGRAQMDQRSRSTGRPPGADSPDQRAIIRGHHRQHLLVHTSL